MFAAQTDFSEPGELAFFINPSQLAMLEATMHRKGVLESRQMGGAFAMLRAKDLVWQPIVNQYLKGQRDRMIDLMAWNADGTRMPWRMHSEYLYRLYLDNELATNRLPVGGKLIRLSDISVPMFVVGTEADHVAPWKSVYKVDNLVRSDDLTFLLTAGGHNAGIVAGPVHPKRHYRIRTRRLAEPHLAPEDWMRPQPSTPAPGGQHGNAGWCNIPAARPSRLRWELRSRAIASSTMRRGSTCGNGSEDHRRQLARRQPVGRADDRPLSLRVVGRRAGLRRKSKESLDASCYSVILKREHPVDHGAGAQPIVEERSAQPGEVAECSHQRTIDVGRYQTPLRLVVCIQRSQHAARDVPIEDEPQAGGQQLFIPGVELGARAEIGVQKIAVRAQNPPYLAQECTEVSVTV